MMGNSLLRVDHKKLVTFMQPKAEKLKNNFLLALITNLFDVHTFRYLPRVDFIVTQKNFV